MTVRLTVRGWAATEIPSFDSTGKPLTLRSAMHVDIISGNEHPADVDLHTQCECCRVDIPDLAQISQRLCLGLLKPTHRRFIDVFWFALIEAELYGIIAIGLLRLDLRDIARSGFKYRGAMCQSIGREELGHAHLLSQNHFKSWCLRLFGFLRHGFSSLL